MTRRTKPTPIRGVVYASRKEAAQALGVSHTAIRKALEAGRLDRGGMGRQAVALVGALE